MTRRELGSLVIRIFALYLLVSAFQLAVSTLASMAYGIFVSFTHGDLPVSIRARDQMAMSLLLLPAAFHAMAGVCLFLKSKPLGAGLLPGGDPEARMAAIAPGDAQAIAFSIVGLYLAATAVAKFCSVLPIIMNTPKEIPAQMLRQEYTPFIAAIVQLILGVFIFFGGRSLARFLCFLRTATGYPSPADSTAPDVEQNKEE